jgi:hypothetical protein
VLLAARLTSGQIQTNLERGLPSRTTSASVQQCLRLTFRREISSSNGRRLGASTAILVLAASLFPAFGNTWTEYQKKRIAAIDQEPTYEQLQMLCDLVASDSETLNANEIRALAWTRLQQIPDFPDRIHNHIIEAKSEWNLKKGNPFNYNRARGWGIPRLGKLPHHGSVRVLGEFLYDDELPGFDTELEAAVNGGTRSNCIFAIRALGRLIEKPPVQGDPENYTRDDVRAWQLWFEQVKTGNRTFRLKGDPQEYGLAGPVREAAPPLNVGPGDSQPASEQSSASDKRDSRIPFVGIVAAVALLSLALWTVARRNAARV